MNILLICNAGMSTGLMRLRLEDELKRRGIEGSVNAVPLVELDDYIESAEVFLLGPQIRFAKDDVAAKAGNKLTMVIAPQDFGAMNAKKVMDDIIGNGVNV